jgi:antitoxin component of MazEF toxin-antitoxin module
MQDNTTIRKVQAYTGEKSLTIVLPRNFTFELGIEKGDFLKVQLENKRLILEKAEV